jgi:hypothetical protein
MEAKEKTGESTAEPSTKRPYQAPEIRKLGTVAELTLTTGSQPVGDAIPASTSSKNPP